MTTLITTDTHFIETNQKYHKQILHSTQMHVCNLGRCTNKQHYARLHKQLRTDSQIRR